MAEPEHLIGHLESFFRSKKKLKGKKVLITAGPTYEAIDPVRFIGNHSSGKMGYALAEAAFQQGAEVSLVSGPTHLPAPTNGIELIGVTSGSDMFNVAKAHFKSSDINIFAAAMADYAPIQVADQKIKKAGNAMTIELGKTIDIAKTLGIKNQKSNFM